MTQFNKPIIICIVGPSGSGKTTLSRFLEKTMGIKTIVSYTTRAMRKGETNGIDHHFVSPARMPAHEDMLAYTKFGDYDYWALKSDVASDICSYVVDEAGLLTLIENFKNDYIVISVLVKRDRKQLIQQVGEVRAMRDLNRLKLPEEFYEYVFENNGRIEDFLADAYLTLKALL